MISLDFDADYVLENEVVQLRPLRSEDFEHLLPISECEPELWVYSLISAAGRDNLEKYIQSALEERQAKKSYPFIVFDKRSGKYAGSTRFYDIQPAHQAAQLGFTWYAKEFQGTGLNKNCKLLMLEFAFDQLELCRVEFRADNRNQRSIAAMKGIGCQVEGVLRSNCNGSDGRRDSIVLSILQNEWREQVKMQLSETIRRGKSL